MLVGNAMKSGIVVAERLVEALADRRAEVEARLALGQPWRAASRPIVRAVAAHGARRRRSRTSKALGIVFLPGAMTGLILAGVDPVDAVLVQLALMYLILGGVATTTVVTRCSAPCAASSRPTTGSRAAALDARCLVGGVSGSCRNAGQRCRADH